MPSLFPLAPPQIIPASSATSTSCPSTSATTTSTPSTPSTPSSTPYSPSSAQILPEHGLSFEEFLETHQSSKTIFTFYIWHLLLIFVAIMLQYMRLREHSEPKNISPLALLRFVSIIPISFHCYHVIQKKYFLNWKPQPFRISTIENVYLLTLILTSSAALIVVSLTPNCTLPLCEDVGPGRIQPTLLFQNMLFGIISPILLKAHSLWCAWIAYFISFISSIISAIFVGADTSLYFTITAIYFLGAVVLYDNQTTLRQLYHQYLKQEEHLLLKLKSQNEKELLLVKEQQLRVLFGNVAHDLKSPLHGFTLELDLLADSLQYHDTQSIKSIQILKSICNFMLMTINRAVDYSKVSSGIHLVPSIGSVNLINTFSWVLNCIGNDQIKDIPIRIEPYHPTLCLNILTDSQWLRDNLLCLISNSLKFTSTGMITIRCFLTTKEKEGESKELYCHGISQRTYDKLRGSSVPASPSSSLPQYAMSAGRSDSADTLGPKGNIDMTMKSCGSCAESTQYLRIEIEDTGLGIDPNQRSELFQPFKHTHKHAGGTGLGLFSLLKRVECLGGDCGVTNRRDHQRGSLFWFTIPYFPDYTASTSSTLSPQSNQRKCHLVSEDIPEIPMSSPPIYEQPPLHETGAGIGVEAVPAGGIGVGVRAGAREREITGNETKTATETITGAGTNVLLVEDSILIQKTTSRALSKRGYTVDIARHGGECLEMVKIKRYDFILMDINMPVMDGIEATMKIREEERNLVASFSSCSNSSSSVYPFTSPDCQSPSHPPPPLCIIGISANGDSETIKNSLDIGMNDFLLKPLCADQLIECFERLKSPV